MSNTSERWVARLQANIAHWYSPSSAFHADAWALAMVAAQRARVMLPRLSMYGVHGCLVLFAVGLLAWLHPLPQLPDWTKQNALALALGVDLAVAMALFVSIRRQRQAQAEDWLAALAITEASRAAFVVRKTLIVLALHAIYALPLMLLAFGTINTLVAVMALLAALPWLARQATRDTSARPRLQLAQYAQVSHQDSPQAALVRAHSPAIGNFRLSWLLGLMLIPAGMGGLALLALLTILIALLAVQARLLGVREMLQRWCACCHALAPTPSLVLRQACVALMPVSLPLAALTICAFVLIQSHALGAFALSLGLAFWFVLCLSAFDLAFCADYPMHSARRDRYLLGLLVLVLALISPLLLLLASPLLLLWAVRRFYRQLSQPWV
jgi:hypothetical protein